MPEIEIVGGSDDGKTIGFSDDALDDLSNNPRTLELPGGATYELREDGRLWLIEDPTDHSKGVE